MASSMAQGARWRTNHMPRYLGWYLLHHGLNAVFYMLSFGSSVFVLFLDDLGLGKDRIGLVLSLFPFCGLVAPFISGAVTRFGLKRTYITFYGIRKFVMLLMLLAPWVLDRYGATVLFVYITGVLLVFALCRATAETAYYPWSREFIPDAVRGWVGGQTNVVVSLTSALAMLLASVVLSSRSGYGRYQLLIGIASFLGVISVLAMLHVPAGSLSAGSSARPYGQALRHALSDRRFRGFLLGVMLGIAGVAGYPFLPLLARERLLVPEARVVLFDVANTVGALVSSLYWGWAADRYGGKPLTLVTLGMVGFLPWIWLLLPPGTEITFAGGLILAFLYGVASIGMGIASYRWFLNDIVPMEERTAYTSIWYAGSGLAGGLAPFAAGWILRAFGALSWQWGVVRIHAFTVLFAVTTAVTLAAVACYHYVRAEGDYRARDYMRATVCEDLPRWLGAAWGSISRRSPLH